MIRVENLTKTFSIYKKAPGLLGTFKNLFSRDYVDVHAVENLDFEIEEGEVVGFIGPNGAGKTTTLKMLSGLLHPTSGRVEVMGYVPWERNYEYLKKISLVMGQKNQLWWDLPVIDSLKLNKEIYQVSNKQFEKKVSELTELLEIKDILNVQVRMLSLGQRMKCELACALLHSPKVLFLDEPTIGLDIIMQKKLRSFFKEYNKEFNTTIMLTSHYMDDVKELCERVIVINGGSLAYDGSLSALVKKYAKRKNITFYTKVGISKSDLSKLGEIVELDSGHGIISVERDDVSVIASKLLSDYKVEDIDIKEIEIEDVIESVFSTKRG